MAENNFITYGDTSLEGSSHRPVTPETLQNGVVAYTALGQRVAGRGSIGVFPTTNEDFFEALDQFADVTLRSNMARYKCLGDTFTDEQKARIADGSFKGFFVGDYWEIGGHKWRIVDINYWMGMNEYTDDNVVTANHLVIMPDKHLYKYKMYDSQTTSGGYANSKMRIYGLEQAKTTVNNVFGEDYVLTHRELLVNSGGEYPSGVAFYDSTLEIPSEFVMFGHGIMGDNHMLVNQVYREVETNEDVQFALFRLNKYFIGTHEDGSIWLRDMSRSIAFCTVNATGKTSNSTSWNLNGVRPYFGLTGGPQ